MSAEFKAKKVWTDQLERSSSSKQSLGRLFPLSSDLNVCDLEVKYPYKLQEIRKYHSDLSG